MKFSRLLVVCCVLFGFLSAAQAQDTTIAFDEIPQSRTEDGAFLLGNPDAPVTIILFSDFICPGCLEYYPSIRAFMDVYVEPGYAQLEYRFVPSADASLSTQMAQLAECVDTVHPGRFWEAFDQLYTLIIRRGFNPAMLEEFISTLELDEAALTACRPNASQVAVDTAYARSLGVSEIPSVLVRFGDGRPGFIQGLPQPSIITLEQVVQAGPPQETPLRDEGLLQDASLISAEPCGAPCWNSIVPGETSFEDAIAIVRAEERFANNVAADNPQSSTSVLRWADGEGRECCRIFSDDGVTVSVILLLKAPDATTEEVIEVHGEPEFMTFSPVTDRQTMISLIYAEQRFVVYVYADAGETGEVKPNSEVIGTLYMDEANMESYLLRTPRFYWAGYQLLADYAAASYDILPSATGEADS